jgi:predicted O-methyltransferase YrrM
MKNNHKILIKKLLNYLGLYKIVRMFMRKKFAYSYYKKKLSLINKWYFLDTEDSNFYYNLTTHNLDILANTVSLITKKNKKKIKDYFNELQTDFVLRNHIEKKLKKNKYGKDIKVDYGRRYGWYAIVRAMRPKIIIETGVSHGVGSCVLAKALMKNKAEGYQGYYYGTELDLKAGKIFSGKYKKYGKILYGDSVTTLKKFNFKIDLFINDSDHDEDYEYLEYEVIANKISNKSIILGDNSHVTDKLSLFSEKHKRKFIFFREEPLNHWYPGAGIGISFK